MSYELSVAQPGEEEPLRSLARRLMPKMPDLHKEPWPSRLGVQGQGLVWLSATFLVVKQNTTPVGFAWADPALLNDQGICAPWWCINAVAVEPEHRRRGLGQALVQQIVQLAKDAGVTSVYALIYRDLAPWYRRLGFEVGEPGMSLRSSADIRAFTGHGPAVFDHEHDELWAVLQLPDPTPPPRLMLHRPLIGDV